MSDKARFVQAASGGVVYVTADGDMVDDIAHTYYGSHEGNTERVLEANPGLADRGEFLPAGVLISMPAPVTQASTAKETRKLWD